MKMFLINKTPLRTAIAIIAIAIGATLVAPVEAQVPNQGGLLFSDNFNTTTPGTDINADIFSPTRVSGPLAGTVSYDTTNALGTLGLDGSRLTLADSGRIGLNQNFTGNMALGGMKISYDFQGLSADASWAGILFGADSSALPAWGAADANFAAVLQFDTTLAGVNWYTGTHCLNDTNGIQYQFKNTGVNFNDAMHHVDVILADMVDGTFANGAGIFAVEYYIDGKCVMSSWDQTDGADYVNNYLGFLQAAAGAGDGFAFDNLKIYGNDLLLDTTNQWQVTESSNWTDSANWSVSVPNARGANALILSGYLTMNVDQDVVVGNMCVKNDGTTIMSSSGNKITFWANAGTNSQLQVLSSRTESYASIELKNDLDITVAPLANLDLYGSVTAPDGPVNVSITPSSAGYPGDPLGGVVKIANTFNPGGAFNLFGGTVNVVGGGSLTASSVYLGDRKSWNVLNVDVGATLTTDLVAGDGQLQIYGGTFSGITHKPTLDIRALVLSGGSTYTIEQGETIICAEILGKSNAWSTLTFDGGTMQVRPDPYGPYGANLGLIGYSGLMLGNVYVTDKGGKIDLAGNAMVNWQGFEDAPGLTAPAGAMTVTNGFQLSMVNDSTFTGGWFMQNVPSVYATPSGLAFGTGTVDFSQGSALVFAGSTETGSVFAPMANKIVLHGASANAYYAAIQCDWTAWAEISGEINVNNSDDSGSPASFSEIASFAWAGSAFHPTLTLSGPITGPGVLSFGRANAAYSGGAGGYIILTGSESNTLTGPMLVTNQFVELRKTNGAVAVTNNLIIDPNYNGGSACVILGGDNQTTNNTIVQMNSVQYPTIGRWTDFSLNGHATTIRGLVTPTNDGINGVENGQIEYALGMTAIPVATTPGQLTIDAKEATDVFSYAGYICDNYHGMPAIAPALSIVKTGPGTQKFTASPIWAASLQFGYTGGTTVKEGTLDVSTLSTFTPSQAIHLEGGTLLAGNLSAANLDRGSLGTAATGTLEVGGTTFTSLTLTGAVNIAAAKLDAGQTLVIAPANPAIADVIDVITGAGTVQVADNATLTSRSIVVDSLVIGGAPVVTPSSAAATSFQAVPEPSTLALLVLAGLSALLAWRRK
jgi:hypothetical protein